MSRTVQSKRGGALRTSGLKRGSNSESGRKVQFADAPVFVSRSEEEQERLGVEGKSKPYQQAASTSVLRRKTVFSSQAAPNNQIHERLLAILFLVLTEFIILLSL